MDVAFTSSCLYWRERTVFFRKPCIFSSCFVQMGSTWIFFKSLSDSQLSDRSNVIVFISKVSPTVVWKENSEKFNKICFWGSRLKPFLATGWVIWVWWVILALAEGLVISLLPFWQQLNLFLFLLINLNTLNIHQPLPGEYPAQLRIIPT